MSDDNRFKPPEAILEAPAEAFSRGPVIAIAVAGLLQLAWLALTLPRYFMLVEIGAMVPIGPFLCLLGCLCLYVGLWRVLSQGTRGRNLFGAALALLLAGLLVLNGHHAYFSVLSLLPFDLAAVIAASGLWLTWGRIRARGRAA